MIILGIDPGLNSTGYGVVAASGRQIQLITAGDIRPLRTQPLQERLNYLHKALTALLARHHPDTVALEMVFTHQDYINTAALMAHARGVVCLAIQQSGTPLVEYPTARVKKAVAGRGAATKEQVARMITQWLGTRDPSWSFDATDALALAVAHAHMQGHKPLTLAAGPRAARQELLGRMALARRGRGIVK